MSLGPCADGMGLSAMSTYGISVGQLPAMFIVVLRYPHVRADFFVSSVRVVGDPSTNGTAVDLAHPTTLHYMHSVNLPFVFMVCSALYAAFSMLTMQMIDKGVGQMCEIGYSDYTSTNTELSTNNTITLWNSIFLWMVVAVHSLLAAVLTSPTSIHFVLLVTLLNYVSLGFILQPRIQWDHDAGPGAASAVSSQYLCAIAAYSVGMMYVCTNIPHDPESYKIALLGMLVFFDVFLLVMGHTWDPVPNMQTIVNCRMLYVMLLIAFTLLTYMSWEPLLRVPYIDTGAK